MSAQRAATYDLLRDDTEEDLVGADWHQRAIRALSLGLQDLATQRGWAWHVGDQLTLVGWKPDGSPWRPSPDILVHPSAGPTLREEFDARAEGLPVLLIEVASKSTWKRDVDTVREKAFGYLSMGVPEYIVFDPVEAYLPGQWQGWRQVDGAVHAWQPEPDGRYHSLRLDIAFQPDGDLLRIFDPEGNPVPYPHENAHKARTLQEENAALRAELDRLRGQN